MKTSRILVAGMCCPSEEPLIKKQLSQLSPIGEVRFDHLSKQIEVEHGLDDERALVRALNQVGLKASMVVQGKAPVAPLRWLSPRIAAALALAMSSEVSAWVTSDASPSSIGLAVLAIVLVGTQPWDRALLALGRGQLGINVLMTVAVIGAIALGQWPEAAMVLTLFTWSEQLESYSLARVRCEMEELLNSAPEMAEVQREGNWVLLPSAQVGLGEVVRVSSGDRVPVDGRIVEGESSLNQASITGESIPVEKGPGDEVFAGTLNEGGLLLVCVNQPAGERQVDRIFRAVQRAQQEKAPVQRAIDRFASIYTPLVLLLALSITAAPWLLSWSDPGIWFYRALVLLVIACPCALVLATPITMVSGLTLAARKGILVKGSTALEEAARIKVVAFDKTGTLTVGRPTLGPCQWLDEELPLLQIAASLQDPSRHPLARAVVEELPAGTPLLPVEGWRQWSGRGVVGRIQGREWMLVSHRHIETEQLCGPELHRQLSAWEEEGRTTSVLLCERQPKALLSFSDPVRSEASQALQQLRTMGIETLMITGDHHQIAKGLAEQLKIERFFSNQLPEEKLERMEEELSRSSHVAMVGDGVNDAPTLARSSLGIAMGQGGTATAVEVGDVVLMVDDLRRIPELLRIARLVKSRLRANIALALVSKFAFLALTMVGKATLWMAVLADVGVCLVVVANGLRLVRAR